MEDADQVAPQGRRPGPTARVGQLTPPSGIPPPASLSDVLRP